MASPTSPKPATSKETAAAKRKRTYTGQDELDHDLFQLKLADMKKNLGIDSKDLEPEYTKIPHTHFFHSIDGDGRPQTRSIAIGGHSHAMTVVTDPEGGLPVVTCGPASREVRRKKNGKFIRDYEVLAHDPHTHEVAYIRSDRVKLRKANADAANVIAAEAQKTAPIPGVQ